MNTNHNPLPDLLTKAEATIADLRRQLAEAKAVVNDCMRAVPWGSVNAAKPENIADMITYLAKELAAETVRCENMEAVIAGVVKEMQERLDNTEAPDEVAASTVSMWIDALAAQAKEQP
jgi:hypothetical protein